MPLSDDTIVSSSAPAVDALPGAGILPPSVGASPLTPTLLIAAVVIGLWWVCRKC